jgi:GR25 family glycosyltransferase involved in LPS biosynthesis
MIDLAPRLLPINVINLARRPEKRKRIDEEIGSVATFVNAYDGLKIDPKKSLYSYIRDNHTTFPVGSFVSTSWRDPYHKRRMTSGEVGCFLSHHYVWEKCVKSNKSMIILEDDVEFTKDFGFVYGHKLSHYLHDYDFIYLSRKYMDKKQEEASYHSDVLEIPGYTYWANAYAITPKGAEALLTAFEEYPEIIPTDEFIPAVMGKNPHWKTITERLHRVASFRKPIVNPVAGAFESSDTERHDQIYKNFDVHVLTVGTDETQLLDLRKSAARFDIKVQNIAPAGSKWVGRNPVNGKSGAYKLQMMKDVLDDAAADDDVILFTDGYDSIFVDDLNTIVDRYLEFKKEIVFSAETTCYPPNSEYARAFDEIYDGGKYRYLNSGGYIGTVKEIKRILKDFCLEYDEDDQEYLQRQFLSGKFSVALDYDQYIFHCANAAWNDREIRKNKQIRIKSTNTCTCIMHFNGPSKDDVREFRWLFESHQELVEPTPIPVITFIDPEPIISHVLSGDPNVYSFPFLSAQNCNYLIKRAESHGGWAPLPGDAFPAYEIRLKEFAPDVYEKLVEYVKTVMYKTVKFVYNPLDLKGLKDCFIMRYTMDTQRSLGLHHDTSLVTGSVKLNTGYSGGILQFPRSGMTNENIPLGHMMIFPGQVTHPHLCTELTSGVKYSLTLWTKRTEQDN